MSRLHSISCLCVLVLCGCASAPAAPAGPSCATAGIQPEPLAGGWWEAGDAACPAGGKLKVIEEKKSTLRMCLVGGKQHGPFRAEAGDALLSEGWYVYGQKHGTWRRYDGITSQYVIETYDCDKVLERQPDTKEVEPPVEGEVATRTGGA